MLQNNGTPHMTDSKYLVFYDNNGWAMGTDGRKLFYYYLFGISMCMDYSIDSLFYFEQVIKEYVEAKCGIKLQYVYNLQNKHPSWV